VNICVTGGSGFIGSHFYTELRRRGHALSIIDLVPPASHIADDPQVRYVQGDIRDGEKMTEAARGCDAVLHLAAAHHDFGISREEFFSVNEHGAEVISGVMDQLGIRTLCFYSSVAVYGDIAEPITETSIPKPFSDYGQSKLAGEKKFKAWTDTGSGRTCLVIRPTVTFGVRNFANMYSLIRQIESGKFLPIGDGRNIKSLSYVENIVDATMYLWGVDDIGPRNPVGAGFHVFNYIEKPDMTSRQITEAVYESLGKKMPGFTIPLPLAMVLGLPFDVVIKLTGKNLPVSTARMKKLCTQTKYEADKVLAAGFKPRVTLREGIDRMVKWWMAEGRHQKPAHPGGAQ